MNALEQSQKLKVQNAAMLVFSTHAWGNRKTADIGKIETLADKKFLSVSKKLIDSETYKSIIKFQTSVYDWIGQNAVPAFVLRGAYLFNMDFVETVEDYLVAQSEILQEKIEPLISEYQEKTNDAQFRLSDQFNPNDYPSIESLRKSFSFEWKWRIFDVPDGLPEKIFAQEKLKAENMWKEAADQISAGLRQAFVELIKHANEVLQTDSSGKTKGFKNSTFDNIDNFINTFKNRNIINDSDLETLVNQAKKILTNVNDPQTLKTNTEMREIVQYNFSEISKKLDEMIETKPSRKFDLE